MVGRRRDTHWIASGADRTDAKAAGTRILRQLAMLVDKGTHIKDPPLEKLLRRPSKYSEETRILHTWPLGELSAGPH